MTEIQEGEDKKNEAMRLKNIRINNGQRLPKLDKIYKINYRKPGDLRA